MNTKTIISVTAFCALFTGASVFATPTTPMIPVPGPVVGFTSPAITVDFTKVNPILQTLITQVLSGENQLTYAYPEFDTTLSSAQAERLVYSMKGSLQNTAWGADATASATTDYQVDRTPNLPGVGVRFNATVSSDILKMIQFGAKSILSKSPNSFTQTPAHESILSRAASVQSISDFYKILLDAQAVTLSEINDKLNYYNGQINCIYAMTCGNTTVDQWGNRNFDQLGLMYINLSIDSVLRMRASFESTEISYDPSSDSIFINSPAPQGFTASRNQNGAEFKNGTTKLSANSITASGYLFANVQIQDLDQLHSSMTERLNGIASNDSAIVADTQTVFRKILVQIKQVINAQFPTYP